jgi:GNAT superfamily N-acetyltransferase
VSHRLDEWLARLARPEPDGRLLAHLRCGERAAGDRVLRRLELHHLAGGRHGQGSPTVPPQTPAVLLGRLAVDRRFQGRGLGAALLRHAIEVTIVAADAVGIRLLIVNALGERAAACYRRFGLEPSPTNPLDLMITVNAPRVSLPPDD